MQEIELIEQQLRKIKEQNKLIIVEGKKDKIALKNLGISNIITLNKPLFQIVEIISERTKECIILTDLDKEGKKLYSELAKNLKKYRVKVDDSFRNFLFKETELRQIEGIINYLNK